MRSLEGSRDRKFSSSRGYEPGLALQESVHENVLSLMMNRADRAEILGYLAAEGNEYHYAQTHWRFFPTRGLSGKWYLIHYKQDAVEFTNLDLAIQQRFLDLLDRVYGMDKARFDRKGRVRIRPRTVVSDLLSHSRLGCLSWQVPKAVMAGDCSPRAAWCRGYADGDGTVAKTEICLDSTNSLGLNQVQDLLQSLGIHSKVRGPYSREPYLDRFSLVIHKESLRQYAGLIGFNHPKKTHALTKPLGSPGGS